MNRLFRIMSLILVPLWLGVSVNCTAETIHTHGGKPASHHHHHDGTTDENGEPTHHNHNKTTDTSCEVCPSEIQAPQAYQFSGKSLTAVLVPAFTQAFLEADFQLNKFIPSEYSTKEFRPAERLKFLVASPNSPPVSL